MSNPNIVNVEVLVREGAGSKQAMWVAFKCPKTGRNMTAWGNVQNPSRQNIRAAPGAADHLSLVFSSSKPAAQGKAIHDLYDGKRRKYDTLGRFELDVRRLRVDPIGTDANMAATDAQRSAAARNDGDATLKPGQQKKAPLPKEITHPEAVRSGKSASPGWFF